MTPRLVAPWLLAAVPDGLVAVGPDQVVDIELQGPRASMVALAGALATGSAGEGLTGLEHFGPDVEALRAALVDAGVLGEPNGLEPDPAHHVDAAAPLAQVLAAARTGDRPRSCSTAEELLLIPASAPESVARRALHTFVGGLLPEARAAAYAEVAIHGDGAYGDRPTVDLGAVIRSLDPALVHVVSLRDQTSHSLSAEELEALGAERPHRLGVIQQMTDPIRIDLDGQTASIARARYPAPNLRFPNGGWTHGIAGDADEASLIARAEAAERYAIGRTRGVVLRRARPDELDGAIEPGAISAPNARQAAALAAGSDAGARLWVEAHTTDGVRRWVPAEAALVPFTDPDRPQPWFTASSSGVAAHLTTEEATRRALLELIERDALMWRWIQRVPPARVAEAPLSEERRDRIATLRRQGWQVDLRDLTLDLLPVVMCALRRRGRLGLGMGCGRSLLRAAERALDESLMITWAGGNGALEPIHDPRSVRTPTDHLALHHDPEHAATHEFLFEREDEIDPREALIPPEPLPELVRPVGEVVLVEQTVPHVRPFRVVRALAPGLVPISFGYDREPLGLPRLAHPVTTRDGATLGRTLDLSSAGPIVPHPFP